MFKDKDKDNGCIKVEKADTPHLEAIKDPLNSFKQNVFQLTIQVNSSIGI